jgi:imidazolonepropionase-like amidohydrolase
VSSHTYTSRSIQRAVRNGVLSVEHGNLADQETLELILASGAFLVPTLIIFKSLAEEGVADGLPAELATKIGDMLDRGNARRGAGPPPRIRMAFGN